MASKLDVAVLEKAPVSGLYVSREAFPDGSGGLRVVVGETVRLDVDGDYPRNRVSGRHFPTGILGLGGSVEWVSGPLTDLGGNLWEGEIYYTHPASSSFPNLATRVRVEVSGGPIARTLKLTLGEGGPAASRNLRFESPYFRTVEFEFDRVTDAPMAKSVNTGAHPVHRPAPAETLTVGKVYSRAGVEMKTSPDASAVGLEAGPGGEFWDDQQLHDSMRVFWSRYQARSQWAAWVLFAHRYREVMVDGKLTRTSGMMFDHGSVKPASNIQRQGVGIFGSTIADIVATDSHPAEALRRALFFSVVHETGHCFNLNHSWEKTKGIGWITLGDFPESLSFMNYPEKVADFWSKFEYRFSDGELDFIRHAPEDFVKMGGAPAGEDHALREESGGTSLRLELGVARTNRLFDFLEPVRLELKLVNAGSRPLLVDPGLLQDLHHLSLVVGPVRGEANQWRPYVRYCRYWEPIVLHPGRSITASALVSAGLDGWLIADPGRYSIEASLATAAGTIVAEPLAIRVANPRSRDEEYVAQDYFSDEVGRALALGGTRVMTGALEALREIADRFGDGPAARHAAVALGLPLMRPGKLLRVPDGEAAMAEAHCDPRSFETQAADPEEARRLLEIALAGDDLLAVRTFGPIEHARLRRLYDDWRNGGGDDAARSGGGDYA